MPRYLFTASVGPVQEFIRSARRTRDLWAGSTLLSDISRRTAIELAKHGDLIFPGGSLNDPELNVSNVLLASITVADPGLLAADLKKKANETLVDAGEQALKNIGDPGFADMVRFRAQLPDVIEFVAAWVLFPEDSFYKEKRHQVAALLAARKNCREFPQSHFDQMQVPKSSLDGSRETVIQEKSRPKPGEAARTRLHRNLRLTPGEELDAVGLTKRMTRVEYYPSVSRIAAQPWLEGLPADDRKLLSDASSGIDWLHLVGHGWKRFEMFPYEGSVLYRERHKELGRYMDQGQIAALEAIKRLLLDHRKAWDDPQPYVAVLQADGDRMGRVISTLEHENQHREFSNKLAGFAASIRKIVEDCFGCLIFAAADDVLALLPLHTCLSAARQIRDSFEHFLSETNAVLPKTSQATLSTGLAIGHFLDPMEDLRRSADAAEHHAKDSGRDSLCVHFQPRSGSALSFTQPWSSQPDRALLEFTQLHLNDQVSDKTPYDLARLLALYRGEWAQSKEGLDALKADARRVLVAKSQSNPQHANAIDRMDTYIQDRSTFSEIEQMCSGMMIARRLARAYKQAGKQASMETAP